MSAKSAPQLLQARYNRSAAIHLRSALVILALALLLVASVWHLDARKGSAATPPATPVEAAVAPAPEASATESAMVATAAPRENSRYRALSDFLARRYKVSRAVTMDLVTIAHAAGKQMGLDPLLIIAVIAVESRFNPIAESVVGAKGLMQVIPKYHIDKLHEFGGEKSVFDPETNILVGSQILKEYLLRTGNLSSALQMYAGGLDDEFDTYTGKVMTEKERLQQVLRNTGTRAQAVDAAHPVNLASAK
jgi:soluble lytic murein transglycosylase-like protein